ncbi:hypothetical protein L1887_51848 [Cichorium endivia]|nr:hypothetical protein L1887_51848 [Cichorium endivia]
MTSTSTTPTTFPIATVPTTGYLAGTAAAPAPGGGSGASGSGALGPNDSHIVSAAQGPPFVRRGHLGKHARAGCRCLGSALRQQSRRSKQLARRSVGRAPLPQLLHRVYAACQSTMLTPGHGTDPILGAVAVPCPSLFIPSSRSHLWTLYILVPHYFSRSASPQIDERTETTW